MRGRNDYGITLDRTPYEYLISLFPHAWGQGSFLYIKRERQIHVNLYLKFVLNYCDNF